jgi:hypothetical protein
LSIKHGKGKNLHSETEALLYLVISTDAMLMTK